MVRMAIKLNVSRMVDWAQNERRAGMGSSVPARNERMLFVDVHRIDIPASRGRLIRSDI